MDPRSTYVNKLLTNISLGYKNPNLIADMVFPTVVVDNETGIYFVQDDKAAMRNPADVRRALNGRANRVTSRLTQATYALEEKTLEYAIDKRVMDAAALPFNPKVTATNVVTGQLAVNKEKDLVTTLTGAVTPTDLSGAWSTTSTDIVGTIRSGRDSILLNTGQEANTLILSKTAFDLALENDDIIERLKYTARATEQTIATALADFFGVDRVLIGKGVENTAKEGQTASTSYIWGEYVVLMYVNPSPAIDMPSAGYHLQLANGRYVDEWVEQANKSTIVRANDFYDPKVIDTGAIKVYSNAAA